MRRIKISWGYWLALALLGLLAGCNQVVATKTTPVLIQGADGTVAPVYDQSGQMVTKTETVPEAHAFYEAQAKNEPIFEMSAPNGQPITLPPGTRLVVRVPTVIKQNVSDLVQAIREGKSLLPWAFGIYTVDRLERVADRGISAAGDKNVNVQASDGAGVNVAAGNNTGPATGSSPSTTTTTTSTDDHSSEGAQP